MKPLPFLSADYGRAFANSVARPQPPLATSAAPCDRLAALARTYGEIVGHWSCSVRDFVALSSLADELVDLVARAPEVSLGMGPHTALASPSLRHAFFVAVLAIRIAQAGRLAASQPEGVAKAALMMNLPVLGVQDALSTPHAQPDAAQRIALDRHPLLAAELLRETPGARYTWITAVAQHHEALDGSGYPHGLRGAEIGLEARILKLADLWCALVAPTRMERSAQPARAALHWLLVHRRQHIDAWLFENLRRLTGHYPPGTLVRLANRDTAIVVDAPQGSAAPRRVIAFLGPHGHLFREPVRRDTRRAAYAIRGHAALEGVQLKQADWQRIWALSGAAH